jgi:hypothetical protein
MNSFKIGDLVEITSGLEEARFLNTYRGKMGVIKRVDPIRIYKYAVLFDGEKLEEFSEIELVPFSTRELL